MIFLGTPQTPGAAARRKLLRAAAVIAAALLMGGLAGAAWWWFRAAPVLAGYLPKDTQVYVELPSVTKALIGLSGVDAVHEDDLDAEKQRKRLVEAFADSFELGMGNVDRFVEGIRAAAVAGRAAPNSGDRFGVGQEVVVLLSFASEDDVSSVLKSSRFEKQDRFKGFERYNVQNRSVENADVLAKLTPLERALNQLGDPKPASEVDIEVRAKPDVIMMWFADDRVLAIGSRRMVEDCARVASGEHESLASGNELFERADWPLRSSVLAYVDPNLTDTRELREAFLDDPDPATGALRFLDEGLRVDVRFQLRGKEIPDPALFTVPTKLTLHERLPSDTIAYLELSTRFASSGKTVEHALFSTAASLDASSERELQRAVDKLFEETDIELADLIEISGHQAVVAVVAEDSGLKKMLEGNREGLAMVAIAEISDEKRAASLVRDLRDYLEGRYEVSRKEGGFLAERKDEPSVMVRLSGERHLLFGMGKNSTLEDFEDVYAGKGRALSKDQAHEKARKVLDGRPIAFLWVDAGRAADALLSKKGDSEADLSPRAAMRELEIPIDAIDLEGPDRLNAWAALFVKASPNVLTVELQSLNAVTLAGLWALIDASGSFSVGTAKAASETGNTACDAYVATLRRCMKTASSSQKTTLESILKTSLEQYKLSSNREFLTEQCTAAEKSIKELFDCK